MSVLFFGVFLLRRVDFFQAHLQNIVRLHFHQLNPRVADLQAGGRFGNVAQVLQNQPVESSRGGGGENQPGFFRQVAHQRGAFGDIFAAGSAGQRRLGKAVHRHAVHHRRGKVGSGDQPDHPPIAVHHERPSAVGEAGLLNLLQHCAGRGDKGGFLHHSADFGAADSSASADNFQGFGGFDKPFGAVQVAGKNRQVRMARAAQLLDDGGFAVRQINAGDALARRHDVLNFDLVERQQFQQHPAVRR